VFGVRKMRYSSFGGKKLYVSATSVSLFLLQPTYLLPTCIYDSSCTINLTFSESLRFSLTTRGNSLKLLQHYCHYDLRRHNFTNRIVSIWNSLPNNVVTANTMNTFRIDLINFGNIKLCFIIIVPT